MDKKTGNILKYVLSAGVAAVLLFFSFKGVKWADFFASLKACSWGYVLLSMFTGVCAFYFRALRWRELLLPIDPSTSRRTTFNSINISYIANMVLPRVGEFVRCGYITAHSARDREGHPLSSYNKVLGTVVLERFWDVVTMLSTLVLFLLFTWNRFGSFFLDKMLGPAFQRLQNEHLVWWLVLFVVTALSLIWAIFRFGRRSGTAGKIAGFFKGIGQGVVSCLKMKHAWRFFLWTVVIWSLYIFMSLSILLAVQGISPEAVSLEMGESLMHMQKLGLVDAIFLMLAGSMASVIPVPGGFGAFHYIVALAISSLYGVPFRVGIIFATLSHESQAVTQALCGGASYLDETLRKTTKTQ